MSRVQRGLFLLGIPICTDLVSGSNATSSLVTGSVLRTKSLLECDVATVSVVSGSFIAGSTGTVSVVAD